MNTKQPTKAERESWQAEDYPSQVIEGKTDLWKSFNIEIHPKLTATIKRVELWYGSYPNSGGGIILAGDCGCGKTHLAKAIAQLYGFGATYWNEIVLINSIQDSYHNDISSGESGMYKGINKAELLIYDDLGAYRATDKNIEWLQGIYYNLFDARCEQKKPFMITTNLNDADGSLGARLGTRVYSRVAGALESSRFYVDMFGVPDYRLRDF